jgi:ABC-type branched-subunit amino acid transport system ATPase component/branched-subunit amino acid ABC-type transport system permease component
VDKFVTLTLSGGVSGAIYSLLAVGLVLTYTTSRVFNFGHAATAFATAYLYYQLNTGLGWPWWIAFLVAVFLFAPATGVVWDRLVFRRLSGASEAAWIVGSMGVLIVMPALVLWIAELLRTNFDIGIVDTSAAFKVPSIGPNPAKVWSITDSFVINSDQLLVLALGGVAFALLWALLRFTPIGLRMRAAVDSPKLASLRGVNVARTSAVAWVLSFFLAGLAGVLAAPFPGPFGLSPDNYTYALFVAATAAVIARFRSLPVAFAAGLLLGAARSLGEGYLSGEYFGPVGRWIEGVYGLRSSLPYIILFVALVAVGVDRGKRMAGTASDLSAPPDHLEDLPAWRRNLPWVLAGAGLLGYALLLADDVWTGVVLAGLAMSLVLMSFTVMTGIGGMVSLAQATFVGVGALTAGVMLSKGWPFLPALVAGVVAAAALGAVVALPAIRLGGLPLTLATLALALLGSSVLFNIQSFTNGTLGWTVPPPQVGPIDLSDQRVFVVVLFLLAVAMGFLVSNLQNSASGRAMAALRSSPPGAAAAGVPPSITKLTVFVLSAAIAGFGGVFVATVEGSVRGTSFPPIVGFTWLAIVVIFGVRRPHGAVVAGLMFVAMPQVLSHGIHIGSVGWDGTSSGLIPQILFGLGAIALAKQPEGVLAQTAEQRYRRRRDRQLQSAPPPALIEASVPASVPATVLSTHTGNATKTDPLLELRDVHASYDEVEVLHGVSLRVAASSVFALLGANGAGKSTLCSTVAGLVPVTKGSVLFRGEDITAMPPHERARAGLALVPESRGIFPGLTVEENLELWLPARTDRDSVYDRFENLAQRRQLAAGNLSGGEQQMLSLSPFIARPPALLIADEPTLGLSVMVAEQVVAALKVLRDEGTTLLLVEEKARQVLGLADEVGAIGLGRLQWTRSAGDVDRQELAATYLGAASGAPS